MIERETPERSEATELDRSGATKRPYEPPRILHEETVEVMAAACGGTPGGKNDPTCLVGFS